MQRVIKYLSIKWLVPALLISLLILININFHYLLFHVFAEYFTVFVSIGISLIAYYTYPFTNNRYLLFIGLGYIWIALLHMLHTQTYFGMPFYGIETPDTSLNFWVFTRIFEALLLLVAPFMRYVEYKNYKVTILFAIITLIITAVAMNYPLSLFVKGEGLTALKIGLEYFIIAALFLALYVNRRHKSEFASVVYGAIKYAIILTIMAEVAFTFYSDVYDFMNVTGHIFKFLSFWILLQAIIRTSLEEPISLMRKSATTYEVIPYPSIIVGKDGIIRQVNRAACTHLDKEEADIVGMRNHQLFHPKSIKEEFCPICQSIAQNEELDDCVLGDKESGTVTQYSLSPIRTTEDKISGMVQVSVDMTHTVLLEKSLLNQYELLQNIIDTVPVGIFWKDINGLYLGANELFVKDAKLGSLSQLIGKSENDLTWEKEEIERHIKDDEDIIKSGESRIQYEETRKDENGNTAILSASKVPLKDDKGTIIGIVGSYEDITKRKNLEYKLEQQQEILRYQAHYDVLTHLPNRVLFQDRLIQAIHKAKRSKSEFALLFIDLDQFKQINDTLGHQVGDEVLKIFTSRLKNSVREDDTLARIGGDEFTIILENLKSAKDASILAQKIIENAKQPIDIAGHLLYVSSSIGISIYPKDSTEMQDLLKYSDSAMYKAKEEGRNSFQFYSPEMTQIAMNRVVMQNDLRNAIKNEEFVVYYQPQIDISKKKETLVGLEALVRWEHPQLGQIPPFQFIPMAEETGMIVELDKLVMKMAITKISAWYNEGLNPGVLSLNLAMKQLQQDDFIQTIKKIIEESGCKDKKYLSFEITEGDLMINPESSIKKLNMLKELGIEIAIDDFGTGYSSLSYLKRLPVGKLKIDKSFSRGVPNDRDDVVISKTIIALAKNLNMKVLAEGVETQEQKEFMYENGCYEIQGYFYSKPLPANEAREFILKYQ
ncbi:EAL domain-containing protein [Sulfurimonas sp.]|uniref:bifunctional diguanylate cyclase/phosphodiesterase n=1 Tax=Sulfurimonas sp. TaxID=2022749 RepID=UPI0025E4DEBD|nr:EAL domain-containing protein [Sulfurimonas sp.]MBW6489079.1 EAL domain-containing protein [Sulfurimonas sp.]